MSSSTEDSTIGSSSASGIKANPLGTSTPESSIDEPKVSPTWQLPTGIEKHLETGVIKAASGMVVGGIMGMLLFKSGKGYRTASVVTGLGVAMGSTYTRINYQPPSKQPQLDE